MGINRNIVECKYGYVEMANRGEMVLIETLWNVNSPSYVSNVNAFTGINRNIVECK